MDDGEVTYLAVGLAVLVLICLACFIVWWVTRRVRQAALVWQQAFLAARVRWMPPSPRRDVAVLREQLRQELRYTTAMLTAAPAGMIFRADAQAVLHELTEMAQALDTDMRAIEQFADPAQQKAALAVVAPQARQLIETSYSARQTILRTSAEDRDRQLTRLRDQVDQQSAAAAAYRHGGRDLAV